MWQALLLSVQQGIRNLDTDNHRGSQIGMDIAAYFHRTRVSKRQCKQNHRADSFAHKCCTLPRKFVFGVLKNGSYVIKNQMTRHSMAVHVPFLTIGQTRPTKPGQPFPSRFALAKCRLTSITTIGTLRLTWASRKAVNLFTGAFDYTRRIVITVCFTLFQARDTIFNAFHAKFFVPRIVINWRSTTILPTTYGPLQSQKK